MKHYYAQQAVSLDDNRLIAHPKVGVSYQRSFWKEQLDASPANTERLNRELAETLLSVLAEASLLLRSGAGTYVDDAYFAAEDSDRDRDTVELDFTQIKHRQEPVIIKNLIDSVAPTARESPEVLVTDGLPRSPPPE